MKLFPMVAALGFIAMANGLPVADEVGAATSYASEKTTAKNFVDMVKSQCQVLYPPPKASTWGKLKDGATKAWRKVSPLTGKKKALEMICNQVLFVTLDTYGYDSSNTISSAESEYGSYYGAQPGSLADSDSGPTTSTNGEQVYYDASPDRSTQV
ncbi:hypothetical protein H4R34_003825 [Dimargaris verticillata]|uniref:Uncharacterized protein n=1 Tax=Dimargaris verticillata TaxID=2761393 RepID=A0A9W8B1L2_9FUNG|nr:hypothetical protein H4R34_003825 [Dimargaris verticillata]